LSVLEVRLRRPEIFGDVIRIGGTVTAVDQVGDCPRVHVSLQAVNQLGECTADGLAEVLLDDYGRRSSGETTGIDGVTGRQSQA
jgi:hypothetical protein